MQEVVRRTGLQTRSYSSRWAFAMLAYVRLVTPKDIVASVASFRGTKRGSETVILAHARFLVPGKGLRVVCSMLTFTVSAPYFFVFSLEK